MASDQTERPRWPETPEFKAAYDRCWAEWKQLWLLAWRELTDAGWDDRELCGMLVGEHSAAALHYEDGAWWYVQEAGIGARSVPTMPLRVFNIAARLT